MTPELPPDSIRILHLEDSLIDHDLVCRALKSSGLQFSVFRVDTLDEFIKHLQETTVDVILADYRLPGFTAIDAWQLLQTTSLYRPFILLSGAIGEAAAVEAIKLGFSDYLLKDNLRKLSHVILRAIEINQSRRAKEQAVKDLEVSERRLAEFAGHLQDSIEQERAAIAREVHDDIGGSLAAANLDLAWVSRHTGDPVILGHVVAATEMLKHALGASQRIMLNLRPAILDQGLSASIQWLATSFEKRTGIKTRLRVARLESELSKAIQLTAYRTAQEALTNISKYAHCSLVTLELSDTEGMLTLEITDNGQGISDMDLNKTSSFGIKGLRERAKTVGGWLDVSTQSGSGTSIILSIPLPPTASPASQEDFR
jgi:signal transduction histidine kinase